jgi:hypothetical protein
MREAAKGRQRQGAETALLAIAFPFAKTAGEKGKAAGGVVAEIPAVVTRNLIVAVSVLGIWSMIDEHPFESYL